jgi:hypothetical protein
MIPTPGMPVTAPVGSPSEDDVAREIFDIVTKRLSVTLPTASKAKLHAGLMLRRLNKASKHNLDGVADAYIARRPRLKAFLYAFESHPLPWGEDAAIKLEVQDNANVRLFTVFSFCANNQNADEYIISKRFYEDVAANQIDFIEHRFSDRRVALIRFWDWIEGSMVRKSSIIGVENLGDSDAMEADHVMGEVREEGEDIELAEVLAKFEAPRLTVILRNTGKKHTNGVNRSKVIRFLTYFGFHKGESETRDACTPKYKRTLSTFCKQIHLSIEQYESIDEWNVFGDFLACIYSGPCAPIPTIPAIPRSASSRTPSDV